MTGTRVNIVVVGAGVTGLTTALLLAKDKANDVSIIAKDHPGDYAAEYASPWAGANYLPVSTTGTREEIWDRNTWPELHRLANEVPEAGIHHQETRIYDRKRDAGSATGAWFAELAAAKPWFKDVLPNFKEIPANELPAGVDSGKSFTSVCINTAVYLPWLLGQCLKHGVVLKRRIILHVLDAAHHHHSGQKADIIVNCTGLGASRLGGVEDKDIIPARGQIVIVRNSPGAMLGISGCDDGEDETMYIMERAAGRANEE
ncbi:MAG: hypothetical protein M1825_003129 [Sarcosagium campestre]|nr:MAG: hypothetical protein M1825_003129 [Sarcosagium campestre]